MFRSCLTDVLDWIMPQTCCFCHAADGQIPGLCDDCHADLIINEHQCARCAVPLPAAARCCGPCLADPPAYDGVIAAHRYATPLNHILNRFKFSGQRHLARTLASMMLDQTPWPQASLYLAVPLHRSRHLERGFNQSDELLRALFAAARQKSTSTTQNATFNQSHHLLRCTQTTAQSGLDKKARQKNIRGAFEIQTPLAPNASVILIDDVMTTGATVSECARVLKQAGAGKVIIWVAARA